MVFFSIQKSSAVLSELPRTGEDLDRNEDRIREEQQLKLALEAAKAKERSICLPLF